MFTVVDYDIVEAGDERHHRESAIRETRLRDKHVLRKCDRRFEKDRRVHDPNLQ
jgi:hypothetical protein